MKRLTYYLTVIIILTKPALNFAQNNQSIDNKLVIANYKNWTLENSISTDYFGDHMPWSIRKTETVSYSPDKKYLFFVSHRGDLKNDCNVFRLDVYSTDNIMSMLNGDAGNMIDIKAYSSLVLSSETNYSAITLPQWTKDSKSILFFGAENKNQPQVYKFDINSKQLTRLTNIKYEGIGPSDNLGATRIVDETVDASSIIFTVEENIPTKQASVAYPMFNMTNAFMGKIFQQLDQSIKGYLYYKGKFSELPEAINGEYNLSPDGSKCIYFNIVTAAPQEWQGHYNNFSFSSEDRNGARAGLFSRAMIMNFDSAATYPLINAPLDSKWTAGNRLLWSKDSKYVILINSVLPFKENTFDKDTMAYVVVINVLNGHLQQLEPMKKWNKKELQLVNDISWNNDSTNLLIQFVTKDTKTFTTIAYKRAGDKWIKNLAKEPYNKADSRIKAPEGLTVFLREDVNTPPKVVASNGRKEIYLTKPDTALQQVYIAPVKTISWKQPDGRIAKIGLSLPANYSKSTALPLVIQVYSYPPDLFRPDGFLASSYALQPLVANGFAVLQIESGSADLVAKYGFNNLDSIHKEGPAIVEKIDAVVKMLADSGIIDPTKVGMIGFSRGGYETLYTITHPGKIKLAAAICSDNYTGSFLSYFKFISNYDLNHPESSEDNRLYKGTFWQSKEMWLKQEPSFNIDKVKTPVLFTLHIANEGYEGNLDRKLGNILDMYWGFQINKRPMELQVYPKGSHNLVRPRERYVSLEATVDWMNFWLQGKEDPNPAKQEKYIRWRELRKMQELF